MISVIRGTKVLYSCPVGECVYAQISVIRDVFIGSGQVTPISTSSADDGCSLIIVDKNTKEILAAIMFYRSNSGKKSETLVIKMIKNPDINLVHTDSADCGEIIVEEEPRIGTMSENGVIIVDSIDIIGGNSGNKNT